MSEIFFWFWSNLIQSRPSGACSSVFKMITFLITLSVEKEVIVLEKSLEKSLEFCIEAVRTLNYLKAYNSVYSLSLWVINGLYAFTSVSGSRLVHLCKGFRRALNLVPRAFP